jgi:hypothetical protein
MRWRGPAAIVNDSPILSSERMLYKDYDHRCSFEKNILAVSLKGLGAKTNILASGKTASRKVTLTLTLNSGSSRDQFEIQLAVRD